MTRIENSGAKVLKEELAVRWNMSELRGMMELFHILIVAVVNEC